MQVSGVSLTLTWPLRLCLLRVLLGASTTVTSFPLAFPFQSTLGEVTLHPLFQACVFIYSSRGKWVFPPLLWSFPPTTTFTSFPATGCWACAAAPAFSRPACLFTVPSLLHVFFVVTAYYSVVFFFFPGWGSVCPGGYADLAQGCLWEYRVLLSSPCGLHFPKQSGHWPGVCIFKLLFVLKIL
jgi:hypothetical protein